MKNKKYIFYIVVFWIILLVPVIIIGVINHNKDQQLQEKINQSKTNRTITINNISSQISLDELDKIELSKEYTIEEQDLKYENDYNKKDFSITYTNVSFYGSKCEKEYFFVDEKLEHIIYDIPTNQYMVKDIYGEIVKVNGEPDVIDSKEEDWDTSYYYWYGNNGCLILWDDHIGKNIQVRFEIE